MLTQMKSPSFLLRVLQAHLLPEISFYSAMILLGMLIVSLSMRSAMCRIGHSFVLYEHSPAATFVVLFNPHLCV